MKTFRGSLLVFVMSVQGLLLSSTLHANSSNNSSVHHSNHSKVEPDILTDSFNFCLKQVPNGEESVLDSGFTVVAMIAFDEFIRHIEGGSSSESSFGSSTSKSFVRDFAKLPSTGIKVKQGFKKGNTDEMYDEGHLWSQSTKVLTKAGVLLIAGVGFKCEPKQLEIIAEWMNYPADYISQLFIISSKNRQKAIKNHEIEDVDYQTYFFENFGTALLLKGVRSFLARTGSVQMVSRLVLKKYSISNTVYWVAFQIPNYMFALGNLDSKNSLHKNLGILQDSKIHYAQTVLVTLVSHFFATYVREAVNSYILITVGQIASNAPDAIWEYEHPIKDSMKESFEYYKTLANDYIVEPFYNYQPTESISDDDDYTADL